MKLINGNIIKPLPVIILIFVLISCGENGSKNNSFTNPIIQTDDFFTGSNWNDPHVMIINSKFVMYASASRNFDHDVKIYRLESDDGINWQLNPASAVLEKSESGWDSKSVETPSVVYYKNKFHMFYTGYSTSSTDALNFKIGHAISDDGIAWIKDTTYLLEPNDPYGDPNMTFNQYIVAEPASVIYNDKIYLYFSAVGGNAAVATTLQVIGLTIYNGDTDTWSLPVSILEPDQIIYPRETYEGYSTPNAIVRNGKMHLYFDVAIADPWLQVKIHHAVSDNGITGWSQDSSSLLNREDFSWTRGEIRSPSAIEYNGKLYLYFAGNTDLNLAIGLIIY